MTGLPRIIATTFSFRLMEMACQASYPLNSENASPPGTFTVYLSCAEMAKPPKTASHTAIPIVTMLLRFIAALLYQVWCRHVFRTPSSPLGRTPGADETRRLVVRPLRIRHGELHQRRGARDRFV